MTAIRLTIDGMHCNGCVARVSAALKAVPGVTLESVEVGAATVQLDNSRITPTGVVEALEKVGYDARISGTPGPKAGGCCGGSCQTR